MFKMRTIIGIFLLTALSFICFLGCSEKNLSTTTNQTNPQNDLTVEQDLAISEPVETSFVEAFKKNDILMKDDYQSLQESQLWHQQPPDYSLEIQTMISNYESLNNHERALIDDLSRCQKNKSFTQKNNHLALISTNIFAPSTNVFYDYLDEETEIIYEDKDFLMDISQAAIEEAYLTASIHYEQLLDMKRSNYLVIHVGMYTPEIEAFSFERDGIYHLHVNGILPTNILKGAFYHELFHAYQYNLGYTRKSDFENWMMEAQSIWAVSYIEPELDYHHRYNDALYHNLSFLSEIIAEDAYHSWYQFYYFMCQEKNGLSNVIDYIKKAHHHDSLYSLLLEDQKYDYRLQNLFAEFALYMFAREVDQIVDFNANSPLSENTFNKDLFLNLESNTSIDSPLMRQYLATPGFYLYKVSLDNPNIFIKILSNIEAETTNTSGMLVLSQWNNAWNVLLDGRYDSFYTQVDIKEKPMDELVFIFFNYGNQPCEHVYQYDEQDNLKGKGSITIDLNTSSFALDESFEKNETIIIKETIKKYTPENNDLNIDGFILGDIYYIESLSIDYMSLAETKNDYSDGSKFQSLNTASGNYHYQLSEATSTYDNPLFQMPDSFKDFLAIDQQLEEGLSIFEEYEDVPGISEALEASGVGDLPGLESMLEEAQSSLNIVQDLFPPLNFFIRIKDHSSQNSFNFYRALPPEVYQSSWINIDTITLVTDTDGKTKTSESSNNQYLPNDIFNYWFYNPSYNPNVDLEDFNMSEIQYSLDDIMSIIGQLNGMYDISNLHPLLNDVENTVDINTINSNLTGQQDQKLTYENNILQGSLSGIFKNNKNETIEVYIQIYYDFN